MMWILTWKSKQPTSLAPRHHFTNIKYTNFLALYTSTFNLLSLLFHPTSQAHTLNQLERLLLHLQNHYCTVEQCVVATKCNGNGDLLTSLTINITQWDFLCHYQLWTHHLPSQVPSPTDPGGHIWIIPGTRHMNAKCVSALGNCTDRQGMTVLEVEKSLEDFFGDN